MVDTNMKSSSFPFQFFSSLNVLYKDNTVLSLVLQRVIGTKELYFWGRFGNRPVHPSPCFEVGQGYDFQSVHVAGLHQMILNIKTQESQEETCCGHLSVFTEKMARHYYADSTKHSFRLSVRLS